MKTVQRKDLTDEISREILDKETHHDHEIILDDQDVIRWKADKSVRTIIDRNSLNDIIILFNLLGHDKNSEIYRKLYRDMGYSLSGYWEIFYWSANNPNSHKYRSSFLCKIKSFWS
jgi:N-acyl-D-aspartate/D-glutamate deacylase